MGRARAGQTTACRIAGFAQESLDMEQLLDDFAGREIADHPLQPRKRRIRSPSRAHLRADAGRAMLLVVAQQDAFDALGVAEFEQQLLRAVGRALPLAQAAGPDRPFDRQPPRSSAGRSVISSNACAACEEPLPHLARPVRRQPLLDEPIAKLDGRNFQNGIHASARLTLNSAKLPVQLLAAEDERGGPAVGAVVGVVNQVALLQKCGNLFGRQPVARLDCRLAGDRVQQLVEQIARGRAASFPTRIWSNKDRNTSAGFRLASIAG